MGENFSYPTYPTPMPVKPSYILRPGDSITVEAMSDAPSLQAKYDVVLRHLAEQRKDNDGLQKKLDESIRVNTELRRDNSKLRNRLETIKALIA